jgi:WD40 repeat protein
MIVEHQELKILKILFFNCLKVSLSPAGLIRCIAVGPSGHWVAVGQSSGYLTVLDIRTGMVLASWKGHDGEVLQLVAASDNTLVSSSLDQTVSAWTASDGKLSFHMKYVYNFRTSYYIFVQYILCTNTVLFIFQCVSCLALLSPSDDTLPLLVA